MLFSTSMVASLVGALCLSDTVLCGVIPSVPHQPKEQDIQTRSNIRSIAYRKGTPNGEKDARSISRAGNGNRRKSNVSRTKPKAHSKGSAAATSTTGPDFISTFTSSGFDPLATNNIAVYYGQSARTSETNLLDLCTNPDITIINFAFVSEFFGYDSYPTASFGPACAADDAYGYGSGMPSCTQLGEQISTCQSQYGKKIFVSLGGYGASSSFPTVGDARAFARTLWNLFGPSTEVDSLHRPFGPEVVVDGFDIDNEDQSTAYWIEFVTALRQLYNSPEAVRSGKSYYLSSTPQCPMPDASIPIEVMHMSDFVNVQFYNNPTCDLNSGQGFIESFQAWSQSLAQTQTGLPRLLIAAPAWSEGASSGYLAGNKLKSLVQWAKSAASEYANFGGIAMWDGLEGLANVDSTGTSFVQHAAMALQ